MSSLKRFDGEVVADNRASGLPVPGFRQSFVEMATAHCYHCGGCVVLNPQRTRAREYCRTCDRYICDGCAEMAKTPDYVHRTIDDLTNLIQSGRFVIAGGTVCNPIIKPVGVT